MADNPSRRNIHAQAKREIDWRVPVGPIASQASPFAEHFSRKFDASIGCGDPKRQIYLDQGRHARFEQDAPIIPEYGRYPFTTIYEIMRGTIQKHRIIGDNVKSTDIQRIFDLSDRSVQAGPCPSKFVILLDNLDQSMLHCFTVVETKPLSEIASGIICTAAVKGADDRGFEGIGQRFCVVLDVVDETTPQQFAPLRSVPWEVAEESRLQTSDAVLPQFWR